MQICTVKHQTWENCFIFVFSTDIIPSWKCPLPATLKIKSLARLSLSYRKLNASREIITRSGSSSELTHAADVVVVHFSKPRQLFFFSFSVQFLYLGWGCEPSKSGLRYWTTAACMWSLNIHEVWTKNMLYKTIMVLTKSSHSLPALYWLQLKVCSGWLCLAARTSIAMIVFFFCRLKKIAEPANC